jgi:hypothetical protein
MPTTIRPVAEGSAGAVSRVAVGAFGDSEVLTAVRNGSGDLELIGWTTAPADFAVTRTADSGSQAGEVSEVALALHGRRAITAVRAGDGHLLLISWDTPPGLGTITRTWDSGTTAGQASDIALTTLGDDLLVTACRAGDGHLLLISWRLEPDGTVSRLHDSAHHAGEVDLVTVTAVDAANVVTPVRNGSGNLELIGWGVDPGTGAISRWGDSGSQAGEVGEIAATVLPSFGPAGDVLTAVRAGDGHLLLITWHPDPVAGTITRVADSADGAGTASAISVCATTTASGPKFVAAMRRGSGNLELIAFQPVGDGPGGIMRTGSFTNEADSGVTLTTLQTLDPGRILATTRITRGCEAPANHLLLTSYRVEDPVTEAEPTGILDIRFDNPPLPAEDETDWAASGGDEYPLDIPMEWPQTLAPDQEYEGEHLVGCSGWVVAPDDSGGDVPFDHPMGFDWEFQVALDDDDRGFQRLLSPVSTEPEGDAPLLARALGLPTRRGLLGLEWDKDLLPASFRGRVKHGDRVAAFGRWILDAGHSIDGFWRTEIHPPLLLATGSVQDDPGPAGSHTRVLFLSRPFLVGNEFTQDVNTAYDDQAPSDGHFFAHLISELFRVINLQSRHVEAHPKIKSFPFQGNYQLPVVVRPPRPRATASEQLTVSFAFRVRPGCHVQLLSGPGDEVEVVVAMNSDQYTPPRLPERRQCNYQPDRLDKLSQGAEVKIIALKAITIALAALKVPFGGLALALYTKFILDRGIITDRYARLPEQDVMDPAGAVLDTPASAVLPGQGITVDHDQPYPVIGWIQARWAEPIIEAPAG